MFIMRLNGNFSSIFIMFLAEKSLGEEFDLKTVTFVLTSRSSRIQILTAKIIGVVLANMLIGLCGGILYDIALIICKQPWTLPTLFGIIGKEILIYMIFGFAIGATAVMIACFYHTTIIPFIYLMVLFLVMPSILQIIGQQACLYCIVQINARYSGQIDGFHVNTINFVWNIYVHFNILIDG